MTIIIKVEASDIPLLLLYDEQGVARMETARTVGDNVAVPTANHHHETPGRDIHVAQSVATRKMLGCERHGLERRRKFVGKLHAEILVIRGIRVDQFQAARQGNDCCPLNQQRKQGDEEHDVEYLSRPLDMIHYRIGRKDDWDGTAQTDPRNESLAAQRELTEGSEREKHTQRTTHENHKHTYQERHGGDIHHLVGIDEQTEHQEDNNLPQ